MLYIVSTPIGNLDDLSYRQAQVLTKADIVLCEDTRSFQAIAQKIPGLFPFTFNPNQKHISYYKEKEMEKLQDVIQFLKDGLEVALVSEAGTPVISDPGYLLIKAAIQLNLPFTVIPGPSAENTSFIYAGFPIKKFSFMGFVPKKDSEIRSVFRKLVEIKKIESDMTFAFFDSALRVSHSLTILNEIYPSARVVVCRELTKMYEEALRGSPEELSKKTYRGEITIVIS